jgi:type II secretory pathway component PulM
MNPYVRLRQFWHGLALRERRLALAGLVILLPVAGYLYVWQPLKTQWTRQQAEVVRLEVKLRELEADIVQVERLRRLPAPVPEPLEALIARAPAGAGVNRLGPDQVELHWSAVDVRAWLAWVAEAGPRGLRIERCELAPAATPGRLTVQMIVARTG